jgi:hypothetical protein
MRMIEHCLCGQVAKSDRRELSPQQEVEGEKPIDCEGIRDKKTRDSTCRYRASRESLI